MKLSSIKISFLIGAFSLIGLTGCDKLNIPSVNVDIPNAEEVEVFIPTQCTLPAGVEVVSLSLDDDQAGSIGSGTKGYDVTVELNRPLVGSEVAVVCYVVRDKQLSVAPKIIAAGVAGVLVGHGSTVTRTNSFRLGCDSEGDVEGAQTSSLMSSLNDTSKERSTKVYVQEIKGVTSFANIPTGIDGVKSNKIRASCN